MDMFPSCPKIFTCVSLLESMSVLLPTSQLGSEVLYGVFTTGSNSITGSAVCAFKMRDILDVFDGRFKAQESPNMHWLPVSPEKVELACVYVYRFKIKFGGRERNKLLLTLSLCPLCRDCEKKENSIRALLLYAGSQT